MTALGCGLAAGGCYQHFQGGTLIGPAGSPPRIVSGPLRDRWFSWGSEAGSLGYPAADPVCGLRGGGCWQAFAGGAIYWTPSTGAWVVSSPFLEAWASQGWEGGWLGYPVRQGTCVRPDLCQQTFEGGTIDWSPSNGIRFTRQTALWQVLPRAY